MTRGGRGSGRSSGLNEIIRASNEELDLDTTDFRQDKQPLVDYPEISQPYKALAPMAIVDDTNDNPLNRPPDKLNNILYTSSINNYDMTRELVTKIEGGVYYSKRKSESDKYSIKRYHQLLKENTEKPKLLDTININNLARCVPAELLIRTTGTASRKVARIAAPDAALRQFELAEAGQANNTNANTNATTNNEEEEEDIVEDEDEFGSDDDYHKDHDNSDNDNDDDDGEAGI